MYNITSYRKSSGSGILRSKSVRPLPLTQQQTTMFGLLGSMLRPVLSLPLKAPKMTRFCNFTYDSTNANFNKSCDALNSLF